MWPFSSDDDGCGAHHFDEWTPQEAPELQLWVKEVPGDGVSWEWRSDIKVRREHLRSCQHSGCNESERRMKTVDQVRFDGKVNSDLITENLVEHLTDEYGGGE